MSKTVAAFEFSDLGVDSPSYFQGAGVAYTDWDEVFVGTGDTAREAANDAVNGLDMLDVLWRDGTDYLLKFEKVIQKFDDTESAHDGDCTTEHGPNCEMEPDGPDECSCHDDCDLQHYVALYVRYQEA